MLRRMVQFRWLYLGQQFAHGHELVARGAEARHHFGQHLNRRELAAVQQHDLRSRGVLLEVRGQSLRGHRAPISAIVGPQHRLISQGLSDLNGLHSVPAMRRPEEVEDRRVVDEPIQYRTALHDFGTDLVGRFLIEIGMRVGVIRHLVTRLLDALRQLGPLLSIAADQKERRMNVETRQFIQE